MKPALPLPMDAGLVTQFMAVTVNDRPQMGLTQKGKDGLKKLRASPESVLDLPQGSECRRSA